MLAIKNKQQKGIKQTNSLLSGRRFLPFLLGKQAQASKTGGIVYKWARGHLCAHHCISWHPCLLLSVLNEKERAGMRVCGKPALYSALCVEWSSPPYSSTALLWASLA
jgi:hypothetical protein